MDVKGSYLERSIDRLSVKIINNSQTIIFFPIFTSLIAGNISIYPAFGQHKEENNI
ncbi:hypothetical protein EZS27_024221 [termite gut metagenome]|uniref:Uncharacterized protein n=1 Tax=termite gut metagenome TaxID=433724 RepID=A0A5J4R0I4_9ZZZZ